MFSLAWLYFGVPFFAVSPHKPGWQLWEGEEYSVARALFLRDHAHPANLALHAFCLVAQLLANAALLNELDGFFGPWWSAATFGAWGAVLCWGAPLEFALPAVALLAAAYWKKDLLRRHWLRVAIGVAPLEALFVLVFIVNKRQAVPATGANAALLAALAGALVVLTRYLARHARGVVPKRYMRGALVLFMASACRAPLEQAGGSPFHLGVVGALLAVLSDDLALLFYCLGYSASLLQGVGHIQAREEATLVQLEAEGARTSYEVAHTVYFPALLIDAIVSASS